ncbi:uncharacterized protein [Polyergus mexicanus]|uniref:uncharacterized protein n=1 Tax=Polyergus mexicanus TaxID=615972 RepID=UPI0038B49B03
MNHVVHCFYTFGCRFHNGNYFEEDERFCADCARKLSFVRSISTHVKKSVYNEIVAACDLIDEVFDVSTRGASQRRTCIARGRDDVTSVSNLCESRVEANAGRFTGAINFLIARIVRLTGASDDLRRRFERAGGGVERREGFSWSEIETAFSRRVLTGAVINFDLIESLRFLEDARDTVLYRIRDVMDGYNSVKVNTVFIGEFVSGDKIDVKTITTKNYPSTSFQSARVSPLYPVEKNSRYPHYSTVLNLEGVEFPMSLNGITGFECINNVSINAYTVLDKKDGKGSRCIVPLRLTGDKDRHVNLLYLSGTTQRDNTAHFSWIKNQDLSRLIGSQLSGRRNKAHICDRADCKRMNECAIILPTKNDKWLKFPNYGRKELLPFVVYADLECALEKREERRMSNTSIVQYHKIYSAGYYARCAFDDANSTYRAYRGEDCVLWFVKELYDLALRAKTILDTDVSMTDLTRDEWDRFMSATHCSEEPFKPVDARVRDYCHLTGRDVANAFPGSVELLPLTKKTYISFAKNVEDASNERWFGRRLKLHFVDSFKFLSTGLEKLASYLDKSELRIVRSEFSDLDDADFELLARKGVFPYEYVDDIDTLLETRLPLREAFHSSLTANAISESDYVRAIRVWERFRVETLGDYSDLYLKTDVLLLADVFENFRDTCMRHYNLDTAYYYTLPGYTWDAMLKYTGIRFELLTDIDMVMFVERGIRGGLSQCSNRYARANNKYLQSYDPSERWSYHLMYFDINNLYGWAMCQLLPYEDFQWVDDVMSIDLMSVTPNSPIGYILEVDLAYPSDLHDSHADLPFCPTRDKLSGKREKKLLATLYDKSRYVTYYRNLQQCVRHGLRVTRIHRILRFAQSPWLRGYIELNTRLRINAKNEFEKNLYKLMNNAVFGKTMQIVRNHSKVRLVTRWNGRYGAEAMIAKPNFHSRSVFAEDLVAVKLRKLEIKFNKSVYVGMCILDVSKIRLHEFHYEYMLPLY